MQKNTKARPRGWWGFETSSIDKKVRPQDDFYHYANGAWLKKTKIPKDESRWGAFIALRVDTEYQLKDIVDHLLKKKNYKKGSPEQMVSDYYRSASDLKTRKRLGAKPLVPLLQKIEAAKSKEELFEVLAYNHVHGISGFFGTFVTQDAKDSSTYLLHAWQSGLSLPDRDYYLLDKPEQKRVRDAYIAYVEKMLRMSGKGAKEAKNQRGTILDIETSLAKHSMSKEDMRDPEKTYHKMSLAQMQKLSPQIDWKKYIQETAAGKATKLIVGQPEFFSALSKLIKDTPLEDLKTYMSWHVINGSAGLLSEKFVKTSFGFYVTTLTGTKVMKPLWRRALGATNGALGDALGKVYVAKHFPPSSKREMDALVKRLMEAYAARIKKLDWMSSATKKRALIKLRQMNCKIGYPKKWESYKGLEVRADDYFGNDLRSGKYEHYRNMRKLGRPIDRGEWFMTPQTVNAYHESSLNDIVFPAAFLQWPFYDPNADAAVNYAAAGSVIGHEITHGFDDQGAKFDGKGNMRAWWQKSDVQKFTKKTKPFIEQASKERVVDEVHINGRLTLGENMADSGGIIIAYDAYQKHLKKSGRKNIDGFSPEERFFLGFAQMERELRRPEFQKMVTLTDPHAPAFWRINGPVSNFEPFYKNFKVKKGDKLYRDAKTRAQAW